VNIRSATGEFVAEAAPVAPAAGTPEEALPASVDRGFTFAILLSALRCTLQYVVLPFVLPWIGVTGAVPPWVTLALSALALFAIVRNVRYLWRSRYSRRWSYLVLSVVIIGALLVFVGVDLRSLFA
jgi:uncharacterized membrane protein